MFIPCGQNWLFFKRSYLDVGISDLAECCCLKMLQPSSISQLKKVFSDGVSVFFFYNLFYKFFNYKNSQCLAA